MKYCLRSRVAPHLLAEADEIKVDYRDRTTIPDLAHTYPDKTIILFSPLNPEELDFKEISQYNLLCNSNFIMNLNNLRLVTPIKDLGIRFMLDMTISSYWELEGLQNLGAEYAYVGIPLFFDLRGSWKYDIKLRAIPTIAYNDIFPHDNGICGQWIRPEDVDKYEDYIDVLEFEACDIAREQTLFKVYAKDKSWSTRLDILVPDLGSPAINRLISPRVINARLVCRQRCKNGGHCNLCNTALRLADPDALPKPINQPIEKNKKI